MQCRGDFSVSSEIAANGEPVLRRRSGSVTGRLLGNVSKSLRLEARKVPEAHRRGELGRATRAVQHV